MRRSFRKSQRVVSSDEFTLILRRGVCVADGVLVMFAVARDHRSHPVFDVGDTRRAPRIGITIPKKVGNAVVRNRWKRLIRESYRTQQMQIPDGMDLIVRPKKGATPDWGTIRVSIPKLAKKAHKKLRTGR